MALAFDHSDYPCPLYGEFGPLEAALYEYWLDIHPGGGRLPGRQHFEPADVAARHPQLLQHLWLVDVEREPLRFRLRLVGSAVYMTSPFARAGHYIDEFIDPASRVETLRTSFERLIEDREPQYRRGSPGFSSHRQTRELSRLSLPLAADGETVDVILNMTTSALARVDRPDFRRAG